MADRYTRQQVEDAITSLRAQGRIGGVPSALHSAITREISADARRRRGDYPRVDKIGGKSGISALLDTIGGSTIADVLESSFPTPYGGPANRPMPEDRPLRQPAGTFIPADAGGGEAVVSGEQDVIPLDQPPLRFNPRTGKLIPMIRGGRVGGWYENDWGQGVAIGAPVPEDIMQAPDPRYLWGKSDSQSESGGRFGGTGLGTPAAAAEKTKTNEEAETAPAPVGIEELLGPSTGALSLAEWDEFMKSRYPDLDFSNPAQAKADANAQRDLDRTAMLAQLTLAAGIVSGAGKSWEGIGKGFLGAASVYDKGFEKYQAALQQSADRYGEQQKTRQAYDLARGSAALDVYTSIAKEDRADRRELIKWANDTSFDKWKFTEEGRRAGGKLKSEEIRAAYAPWFKALEPNPNAYEGDPAEAEKAQKRMELGVQLERSLRKGVLYPPGMIFDVTGGAAP